MPLYMSTFDYKPAVWAELVEDPENRSETVGRFLESAGCKLKGLWYAFGTSDAVRENQKADIRFRTRPLSGTEFGSTQSNADSRSLATSSRCSPAAYMSRTFPR